MIGNFEVKHGSVSKDILCCFISCVIDQDPYFRITLDVAPDIGYQDRNMDLETCSARELKM
ncbi:hypothetical protein C5167_040761 [Papaver somniferum]|uniref:Uncharacterized protein n=1 Tax=Papaver somniferum TaxID=3469 RepID=A0A4Y7IK21_PAPSO|nr:hypothetical protein C5167_040761 [Papaver somniferum]